MRKFLHNLQPSSTGKESLVGGGRTQDMAIDGKSIKPEPTCGTDTPFVVSSLYQKLITEDLTSSDGPSENYWQVISERRRKALSEALEEHQRLHATAIALEEENVSLEVLINRSTNLVNTLKEMMNEETSDDDHEASTEHTEQEDSGLSTPDSYLSVDHIHKKMKTSPDDISDID